MNESKLNSSFQSQWIKKLNVAGLTSDIGMSVIETSDGGFIVAGTGTISGGVGKMLIIKTDKDGNNEYFIDGLDK